MRVTITPSALHGTVKVPASKSVAHRLLICAAFADRPTRIVCRERSQDIDATAGCLRAFGCGIDYDNADGAFIVTPVCRDSVREETEIDCGESGSTLRFLLPVICALGMKCRIRMQGRLPFRPLSPLWEELIAHGAELKREADGSIITGGALRGGDFTLAADVSSQFISGMLFAMPLMEEKSTLKLTGNVESVNYIRMTMAALKCFGADTVRDGDILTVKPADAKKSLTPAGAVPFVSPGEAEVEGDWSNAAFWLVAGKILEGVSAKNGSKEKFEVTGLNERSVQGDRAIAGLIDRISKGDAVIDARDVPDLVPIMSVLASVTPGKTTFTHAERLRIKESDRIKTTVEMLTRLGASAEETDDGLIVSGQEKLAGGTVDSHNDHRIAMSAGIASLKCTGDVIIDGAEAVRKSYPEFWNEFRRLGGRVKAIEQS